MRLVLLSIRNWQDIKKLEVHFENLMIFLGQNNEGVNSLISALLFGFNKRKLYEEDIENNKETMIKMIFYKDKISYKLKIKIEEKDKIKYLFKTNDEKTNNTWKEISYSEYVEFIENLPFIHIDGKLEKDFKEIGRFFYKLLVNEPNKPQEITEYLTKYYEDINITHNDREIYRHLFFELIKKLTEECLDKTKTLLGNSTILFEDPELYLHPQKERELYNYFIKLSNRGLNIYLKTYSSSFLGIKQYKSICIVKTENNQVINRQTDKNIFNGDEVKAFNMNYWINPDRAELFFAKKVILVEGQTDKIVISFLGKKLNIFKYDYSIIECGSKSSIPQFITLLNLFAIPYIVVYDRDNHSWRTEEEIENSNLKNKQIESLINKNYGESLIFDNDVEEEIYNMKKERIAYKNKPFNALKYISEEDYKLPSKLSEKIKLIYK